MPPTCLGLLNGRTRLQRSRGLLGLGRKTGLEYSMVVAARKRDGALAVPFAMVTVLRHKTAAVCHSRAFEGVDVIVLSEGACDDNEDDGGFFHS